MARRRCMQPLPTADNVESFAALFRKHMKPFVTNGYCVTPLRAKAPGEKLLQVSYGELSVLVRLYLRRERGKPRAYGSIDGAHCCRYADVLSWSVDSALREKRYAKRSREEEKQQRAAAFAELRKELHTPWLGAPDTGQLRQLGISVSTYGGAVGVGMKLTVDRSLAGRFVAELVRLVRSVRGVSDGPPHHVILAKSGITPSDGG